jgi:putative ATPase
MQPLAERMRPKVLSDYVGQKHLVGPQGTIQKLIEKKQLPSLMLWGPPGVGKTTLAQLIAFELKRPLFILSAIHSGVKEVREAIEKAKNDRFFHSATPILFIDEIHRFSKSQQDSLLAAVEQGIVTLIGATTENPSFEVIQALRSRCQLYVLESLSAEDLLQLARDCCQKDEVLSKIKIDLKETDALIHYAGGDARKLLNILELVVGIEQEQESVTIMNEMVANALKTNPAVFDKGGEMHYDIISAFIKSIRGSDPNAALYWLARMLEGGEDLSFICRRLLILAAEDIGLANPNALLIANQCFDAVERIGYPESRIILSETTIYLALSAKSNSAYLAIDKTLDFVKKTGHLPVPMHLRNAPTQMMKNLGYGKGYQYAHDFEEHFVDQNYLPELIQGEIFYQPDSNANEQKYRSFLLSKWARRYPYSK